MMEDIKKCGKYVITAGVGALTFKAFTTAVAFVINKDKDIKDITIDDIVG